MTRVEMQLHNAKVILQVFEFMKLKLNPPYRYRVRMGYKELANRLNAIKLFSSRGNHWTFRRLYRMMQRNSVSLIEIERELRTKGHFCTLQSS